MSNSLYLRDMFRFFYILHFILLSFCVSAQEDTLRFHVSENIANKDSINSLKNPPQTAPLNNINFVNREKKLITKAAVDNYIESEHDFEPTVRDSVRILRQWSLSRDFTEEVPIVFDTLFSLFNRYRVIDLYSPVNAQLGNYGLPYYPINFFDRISDPDKFLYSGLYRYMHTAENAIFMDLHVPFTELKWTIGGQRENAEQTFRVKHSQSVNSKLNFGLILDVIFSLGQYTAQRADDKTFTFFTSYRDKNYKLYFSAGVNNLFWRENGGITAKSELDVNMQDVRSVPVNLGSSNDASSVLKNRNFLVVQRYTFLGTESDKNLLPIAMTTKTESFSGTLSHIFELDYSRRTYSDRSPHSALYDTAYINPQSTFDSLSATAMKNTFRVDFTADVTKSLRYVAGFGLRNENFWFRQIVPIPVQDTIITDIASWLRDNNVLLGRFSNYIGRNFILTVDGEMFINRYRKGDYIFNVVATKSFDLSKGKLDLSFTGKISSRTPAFWYNQWSGNNFMWDNDFNKELRTEFGSKIAYPARNLDFRFNFAMIDNYLDFNTLALPSQYGSTLTVMSAAVSKDFKLWKFHIAPDINIQKSSSTEILDIPLATVKTALFFDHLQRFESTNGSLYMQFGVDVVYHTPYYAYSYMPATGRFYRQSSVETGNYPFINAFLNLKLQRTRFFFMLDHANYGLMNADMLYNYEMIPLYPWNTRRFTFGLAWTFYN